MFMFMLELALLPKFYNKKLAFEVPFYSFGTSEENKYLILLKGLKDICLNFLKFKCLVVVVSVVHVVVVIVVVVVFVSIVDDVCCYCGCHHPCGHEH